MSFREARLRGIRAASEAHIKLGLHDLLRHGDQQIDVFGFIASLDIPTLCKSLDGLLGAYMSQPTAGILVTTNRRLPIQRYTAAHELGHFWLNHEKSLDREEDCTGNIQSVINVPEQEIEADAFASEFLLPKVLIVSTAKKLGIKKDDLSKPSVVYQLSLRFGVSYEATWRALQGHDLINSRIAHQLGQISPKEIKRRILGSFVWDDPWADIFDVSPRENKKYIRANGATDIVVISLPQHTIHGYQWELSKRARNIKVLFDECLQATGAGNARVRRLYVTGEGISNMILEEINARKRNEVLNSFELMVDFSGKEQDLPRAMRRIWM